MTEITLKPGNVYWVRGDGTVFVVDPEGDEYLVVDKIGETMRLKKVGKLGKTLKEPHAEE